MFEFIDEWGARSPVVLVPTKYWRTPTADFRARRVSAVIWVNHLLRSSISAMQATARQIARDESLIDVEPMDRRGAHGGPSPVYTRGGWVNVNELTDLIDASGLERIEGRVTGTTD